MATSRIVIAAVVLGVAWLGLTPRDAASQKRQRDLITREELENSAHKNQDLYQAVRSLRPHFLAPPRGNRSMGPGSAAATVLYVDGTPQGDLETLRMIPVMTVEEVRYLEPSKAQHEFGHTHSGGAVLVKRRPQFRPGGPPASNPPVRDTITIGNP